METFSNNIIGNSNGHKLNKIIKLNVNKNELPTALFLKGKAFTFSQLLIYFICFWLSKSSRGNRHFQNPFKVYHYK